MQGVVDVDTHVDLSLGLRSAGDINLECNQRDKGSYGDVY